MSREIHVTLDDDTAALIDSVPLAERSRFIATAIRNSAPVRQDRDEELRRLLQEGAIARADRDRDLAEEWATLEEDVCQTSEA